MDCGPPGPSVHGDSPGKNTGVGSHFLLQGIFLTQGLNPGLCTAGRFFPIWATGKTHNSVVVLFKSDTDGGTSLVVQLLGLCDSTAGAQVWSAFGELRSCMPHSVVQKKKVKKKMILICLQMRRCAVWDLLPQNIQEQRVRGLRMGQGW